MKKFLMRLMLLMSIMFIVAIVLDIIVSKGLQNTPKNHLEIFNSIMNDKLDNDVLILGNSRGATAYNPYYLDSILGCNSRNLSVSGQTYIISDLRYRIYRRNNLTPKLIILNIDYAELGSGSLGFEREQYYPYMNDTLVQEILDLHHFTWLDKYIPLWRYRGNYKYFGLGLAEFLGVYSVSGKQYKGWTRNSGKYDGINLKNVLITDGEIRCCIDDSTLLVFDKLLNRVIQENITPIMVYSPIYYVAQENMSSYFDTIMDTYNQLSKKYNIPILDYRFLSMNYDSVYFKDATHLNDIGAREFSVQLAKDIDSLGLLKE